MSKSPSPNRSPREMEALLACPACKDEFGPAREALVCASCRLAYPLRGGIPILLREEARKLESP